MSGFEVVGVILGVLPLVISGLEDYSDGVDTLTQMLKYKAVVDDLLTTFLMLQAIYHNSCRALLEPLMLSEQTKLKLLSDTEGKEWEDKELGARLERRLGKASYGPYQRAVRRLQCNIELFRNKLSLDKEWKPKWAEQDGMREKLYRGPFRAIKVGFGAEKLQKLVEAIEKDMERIKNLTEGSYVEPVSEQNTCVGTLKKWRDAREHSRRLFNALNSKWGCGCTTAHRASLQLNWGNDQNDETQFEVLFSFEIPAASLPWNWRNVKIKLSQAPNVQPITLRTKTTTIVVPAIATMPPSGRKKVSFGPQPNQDSVAIKKTVQLSKALEGPKLRSGPSKIECLCTALTPVRKEISCLGFLYEDQSWHQVVYNAEDWSDVQKTGQLVSLFEVLKTGEFISPLEKYEVASILASSLLQLYNTPWLSDFWSTSDVYFVRKGTEESHLGKPYVSMIFASAKAAGSTQQTTAQAASPAYNPLVFALGLTLLELHYGRPLSSFATPEDLEAEGKETWQVLATKRRIADRLILRLADLPAYSDAVKRCVWSKFRSLSSSFENEQFQREFYEGVIEPLQKIISPS